MAITVVLPAKGWFRQWRSSRSVTGVTPQSLGLGRTRHLPLAPGFRHQRSGVARDPDPLPQPRQRDRPVPEGRGRGRAAPMAMAMRQPCRFAKSRSASGSAPFQPAASSGAKTRRTSCPSLLQRRIVRAAYHAPRFPGSASARYSRTVPVAILPLPTGQHAIEEASDEIRPGSASRPGGAGSAPAAASSPVPGLLFRKGGTAFLDGEEEVTLLEDVPEGATEANVDIGGDTEVVSVGDLRKVR